MNKISNSEGTCCLPNVDGLIYLRVGSRDVIIGMMGLETVFQQLFTMGRLPAEASDTELVGMARKFNYIPERPAVESDYAAALRKAYAAFFSKREQSQGRRTTSEPIKVDG